MRYCPPSRAHPISHIPHIDGLLLPWLKALTVR
jgi:hypothetical protein